MYPSGSALLLVLRAARFFSGRPLVWRRGEYCGRTTGMPVDHVRLRLSRVLCLVAVSVAGAMECRPVRAQDQTTAFINFDIPSQALDAALDAYSAATGLEVFYNAALAEHRRSTAVVGAFGSQAALQLLLTGTGYVSQITAYGAFTIVSAKPKSRLAADGSDIQNARYQQYFSEIQKRFIALVCMSPDGFSGGQDVILKLWVEKAGGIRRVDVLGGAEKPDNGIAKAARQLKVEAPPAGMPQPVTLVIFPPSARAGDCGKVGRFGAEGAPRLTWQGLAR
jgi:hypothetical protein